MKSRYRHRFFLVLMRKKRGLATPLSRCLYPLFVVRGFYKILVPVPVFHHIELKPAMFVKVIVLCFTVAAGIPGLYANSAGAPRGPMQRGRDSRGTSASRGEFTITTWDRERAFNGTTLFADLQRGNPPRVVEIDMEGEIVWEYVIPKQYARYTDPGFDVELVDGGNVLVTLPRKGIIEVDRSGRIVWSHDDEKISHDSDRLPNGNTLYAFGNNDTARDYQAKEANPDGELVWAWSAADEYFRTPYMDMDFQGWTHTNAVHRMDNGNTLVNLRNQGLTVEVGPEGKTVWEFDWNVFGENPMQHEPELLANGNLLICLHDPAPYRAVEIDRGTGETVWTYSNSGLRTARDCDRLPNGNTLIVAVDTGGTPQRQNMEDDTSVMLEVTPEGETVWELRLEDAPVVRSPGWFYKAQRIPAPDQ